MQKQNVCKKIWFLSYGPKTSKQIRIEGSLNYNLSHETGDMKLNFCMWLEVEECTKYCYWGGCAQARLNMPKVTTNTESALSQEWDKLWS